MDNSEYVIALVPAKLTSIRIPKKNVTDFGGHPLFYYSIRVAQLCSSIDEVFVTSESNEVLKLAKNYRASVINRPETLSLPHITNTNVLVHAVEVVAEKRGRMPDYVVLLQPTHPFRFPAEIEKGIHMLKNDSDADSLLTVLPIDQLRGEIKGNRFMPEYDLPRDKSNEPDTFYNTGSFYILRVSRTLAKSKLFTNNIVPLKLEYPEFEIDIDLASDLSLARCMLEKNRDKFSFFWD